MRMLMLVVMLVAAGACGPSSAQVKTAKVAHYKAPPATLIQIAVEVAERDYKLGEVDEAGARFVTAPQIYSPEGGRQSEGAGGFVNMSDRSIMLALLVEVVAAEPGHVIVVTPRTHQMIAGSPKPRELAPDDPNLPGWVKGRVDSLAVAIYEAAKQHAAP